MTALLAACSSGSGRIAVPNLVGKARAAATQELAALHLTPVVRPVASRARPGTVVAQVPSTGETLAQDGTVTISVSTQTGGGLEHVSLPKHVVTSLGPCPKQDPTIVLMTANAGVLGLNKRLVPVPATTVRVCDYLSSGNEPPPPLVASRLLGRSGTEALEATTNSLPVQPPGPGNCPAPQSPRDVTSNTYLLSFVDGSQQVDVYAGRCGDSASNGTFIAGLTTPRLNEVHGYITSVAVPRRTASPDRA